MELPPNPKQAYGDKKPNVALVPPALDLYAALALGDGAVKYGPYNWRECKVRAMTYVAAIMRHLGAWVDRQELSEAEGFIDADGASYKLGEKPQLAHVAACVAILADAEAGGFLIDNRPPAGPSLKIQGDWHGKLPVGVPNPHPPRGYDPTRYASEEDRRIGKVDDRWVPEVGRPLPVGKYEHAMPDIDQEYPLCHCPKDHCSAEDTGKQPLMRFCARLRLKDDQRFDVV